MHEIIKKLNQEIKKADRPENRHDYQRFFKEKLKERYGLKTAIVRKISNQCFRDIKHLSKNEILDICDSLLESDMRYGRFFAFEWAGKLKNQFAKTDFKRFESWLEKYVNNWGNCDHLCGMVLGELVYQYPESVVKTKKWARSKSQWLRRAAAVSMIVPVRKKSLLKEVFHTADILLTDEEDLVQKGYGWMLKEAGNEYPDEVFAYVMKHKNKMPRTALRYAIEKYPQAKRKEAMKK